MSGLLDCLRWVSALLVVVAHTANLMVARLADTPAPLRSGWLYAWTFCAGFGHQAVATFYVLSGLLVGGPLMRAVRSQGVIPWKKYSVDRIVRIYLVLIPALALCFVLDRMTYLLLPGWVNEFVLFHAGWRIFLGNLLNLQNFFVPFFGSDGPIGTLAIEMWFYISFPLLLAAWCFRYSTRKRVLLVAIGVVLNVALGIAQPAYLLGFIIWGIGVSARLWEHPRFRSPVAPVSLFLVALLAIRLVMRRDMSSNLWEFFVADLVLAGSLHLLLVAVAHLPETTHSFLRWRGHRRIAGFSYSLYATHMPTLFLLAAIFKRRTGFGTEDPIVHGWQWLVVLGTIGTCLGVGFVFSLLTERHTSAIRKWVLSRVGA